MKWKRRARRLLVLLALLLVGLHFYLRSDDAARRVAAKLESTLGVPVRIDSVALGLFGSTRVHGLELGDWLRLDTLATDLSLVDLLRGKLADGRVTLHGLRIRLRFDAAGNLLTVLPRSSAEGRPLKLPALRFEGVELSLLQDGRSPFTLTGISGQLFSAADTFTANGAIDDPQWGVIAVDGRFKPSSSIAAVQLNSERVSLTPARLRSVPFIPATVWDQAEVDGPTRARVQLNFGGEQRFTYRVEANPLEATIRVRVPGIEARAATGAVVIAGPVVTLTDVQARAAGGTLGVSGTLDFRKPPFRLGLDARVDRVDVQRLTRTWGLPKEARQLGGLLSGAAQVTLSVGQRLRIDGTGQGQLDDARFLDDCRTDGPIRLRLFRAADTTQLETVFALKNVDLGGLAQRLGVEPPLAGRGIADLRAVLPINAPGDLNAYQVSGTLRLTDVRAAGLVVDALEGRIALDNGTVSLSQARATVAGLPVTGSASVELREPYTYSARLRLDRVTPPRLPPDVSGLLTVAGNIDGSLQPFRLHGAGTLQGENARLRQLALDDLTATWTLDDRGVSLNQLTATIDKGKLTGSALLPLRRELPGRVELKLSGLDVAALGRELKDLPVKIAGELNAALDGELSPEKDGDRDFIARLDIDAPTLRVANVTAGRLRGRVGYRRGVVRYHLDGDALAGRFEIDGRRSLSPAAGEVSVRLRRTSLNRFLRAVGSSDAPPPLRGQVDLAMTLRTDVKGELTGAGDVQLLWLRWDRLELAQRLAGIVRLRGPVLELPELAGEALGGLARGRVFLHLREPERSWMTANLDRVESEKLLSLFTDNPILEGPLDVTMRAALGGEWRGGGQAVLTRGRVAGIDVAEWRLPYRFSFSPRFGLGQVDVADSSAQLALGRAALHGSVRYDGAVHLDGQLRFTGLEFRALSRPLMEYERQLGGGRASGRLDFAGRDLRSLADLSARLDVEFHQAQAFEMPVFRQVQPFLRGVSAATSVDNGELKAILGKGVWRIQKLTLENRVVRLMAEGSVTLQGRLDLEVSARSGEFVVNPALVRTLGGYLGGPFPGEVLATASEWLTSRLVHLRIDGTLRNPAVRIEPVLLFTEDAIRFFLLRAEPGTAIRTGL